MFSLSRRAVVLGLSAIGLAGGSRVGSAASAPTDFKGIDLGQAKAEGKVVLYTSLDTQVVDSVISGFKAKHGIPVEYFRGGSSDVTSKILAEADAGRIQADVIDSSDVAAVLLMKDKGILRPFGSESAAAVASELRDPDGTWTADRLTQAVIQYNAKELGAQPPKTWADLTAPALGGRLTFFSSANGDGAPRLYTLAKAFGWDLLKKLADNKPLRVATPQLVTQILESGERAAAFCTNDNIAWRSKKQGKPTDFLFPKEGVPTEPGAIGLAKASTRPHAGALFFEYWMSKEGQDILVKSGKYSTRTDVAPPEGNQPLAQIKLITLDYREYAKNKNDILEKLTDIFGGEWGI